jgi:hypothetical protein
MIINPNEIYDSSKPTIVEIKVAGIVNPELDLNTQLGKDILAQTIGYDVGVHLVKNNLVVVNVNYGKWEGVVHVASRALVHALLNKGIKI